MWKFDAKSSTRPLPLLNIGPTGLAPGFVSILTKTPDIMPNLFIKDASSIVLFLQWLHRTSPLVDDAADEEKFLIARLVASHLSLPLTSLERKVVVLALGFLQIFQKISWKAERGRMLVRPLRCLLVLTNR
jgi:sacsin